MTHPKERQPAISKFARAGIMLLVLSMTTLWGLACRMAGHHDGTAATFERSEYPPSPQRSQVVSLGQISTGIGSSETEQKLALFFFGAEPEPGLGLIKPVSITWRDNGLFICDSALASVLRWSSTARDLEPVTLSDVPLRPVAIQTAKNGDLLVVDVGQSAVLRYGAAGNVVARYTVSEKTFRPAGVVDLEGEVWVSDSIGHRILVFDASSAKHVRTMGRRGPGRGEFGAPLGLAATPDGNVCVVDTLNNRVQLLDRNGSWVRDIGGPGAYVGRFGRPKDVAVGPDGTLFVTDAASQRVHAFDGQGRVLLAFGEPESNSSGLSMPAGICICPEAPIANPSLSDGFEPAYYVAVAEQLRVPGVRVYAWRKLGPAEAQPLQARGDGQVVQSALSPHWSAERCNACHQMETGRPQQIAMNKVDALCISCHDGDKASAEPHPIGRLASAGGKAPPSDWPLVEGRIGCLTCHNVRGHCDVNAVRPTLNAELVRDFTPERRMDFCNRCHDAEQFRRFNPHIQIASTGKLNEQTCLICHTHTPEILENGNRTMAAALRLDGSAGCLTCHAKHWDVSERGHVDRLASSTVKVNMQRRRESGVDGALPLWNDHVTCFSCHDPHQPGLFPTGSELASSARHPVDIEAHLRVDLIDLCSYCHGK